MQQIEISFCINSIVSHDVGASTYSRNTRGDFQHVNIYMSVLRQRNH